MTGVQTCALPILKLRQPLNEVILFLSYGLVGKALHSCGAFLLPRKRTLTDLANEHFLVSRQLFPRKGVWLYAVSPRKGDCESMRGDDGLEVKARPLQV